MDKDELAWNVYSKHVDMYPKYLELVLKFDVFFLGIAGAIVSYVLKNQSSVELLRYVLLFPIVLGFLLSLFFAFGALTYRNVVTDMKEISEQLKLEHWVRTDGFIYLCWGSAIVNFLIVIGISIVYCKS